MVYRILHEFGLSWKDVAVPLERVQSSAGSYVTKLNERFKEELRKEGWLVSGDVPRALYPESRYEPDFARKSGERYIFGEIELSDPRRAVNAHFMDRCFRAGYLRLGIYIAPEGTSPEKKLFYSNLKKRYDFVTPTFPFWLIGFRFP